MLLLKSLHPARMRPTSGRLHRISLSLCLSQSQSQSMATKSKLRPLHPVTISLTQRHSRFFSQPATTPRGKNYEAVVVGAGPAGVAVVGNLLEVKKGPVLWVDERFEGGRLNRFYREVPSNTKVKRFIGYAEGVSPFREIAAETLKPNPYTALKDLNQEKTCYIAEAADLCMMLTEGLNESRGVVKQVGRVERAALGESNTWTVNLTSSSSSTPQTITAPLLILCTGSSPTVTPLPAITPQPTLLPLDPCLKPSLLRTLIPTSSSTSPKPLTIAVIGASHSAILVLRNLYHLSLNTSHSHLRIKWFTRHPLRYAEERDGWIFRDNTGLKGDVADWARENLEEGRLEASDVGRVVRKIVTSKEKRKEEVVYKRELPDCGYVVQAVGFKADETVVLARENGGKGKEEGKLIVKYDHENGGFMDHGGKKVAGLYGAGIAWPERVVDPEGNVEYAVGLFKFMSYLKRVVPGWK